MNISININTIEMERNKKIHMAHGKGPNARQRLLCRARKPSSRQRSSARQCRASFPCEVSLSCAGFPFCRSDFVAVRFPRALSCLSSLPSASMVHCRAAFLCRASSGARTAKRRCRAVDSRQSRVARQRAFFP